MRKRLQKNKLSSFLEELKKQSKLIAPINSESGIREFSKIEDTSLIRIEGENPIRSPKEFLFPQMDEMYTYSKNNSGKTKIQSSLEIEPQIILGVRPCDLHALVYMKKFYSTSFEDPYVTERIKSTLIIGWACTDPKGTCFCTSLGNSPVDTDGADIMMATMKDWYVVEAITNEGKKLLETIDSCLEESLDEDSQALEMIRESTESMLLKKVDLPSIKGNVGKAYDAPIWEKYSNACISCGACTFNCPTCTCFDVADRLASCDEGCRYRTWDTCQNYAFTLHASGHNPRGSKKERLRQRVMHKYHYSVVQLDTFSCTGCGRCTQSCPVGINMVSIISDIKEVVDNGQD